MCKVFSDFSLSNWIEFWGIIAALITSIIAIFISIKTLKQSNKVIEEASRPYLNIYGETIVTGESSSFYLVVRNSGNTPAIITDLSYDFDFSDCYKIRGTNRDFLKSLINCPILNGQSKICNLNYNKINQPVTFKIDYKTYGGKFYHESYTVDLTAGSGLIKEKSKGHDILLDISYTLQEHVQREL